MNDGTCSIDECERPAQCRSWCGVHYQRWRRNGDPVSQPPTRKRPRIVGVAECTVEDCQRASKARGWCGKHYERWKRTGDPTLTVRPFTGRERARATPECSVADCDVTSWSRGWCGKHYRRWRKYGDPLLLKAIEEWSERPRVNRVEPCIIEGCESVRIGRGWCSLHWWRWKRLGDPLGRMRAEVVDGKKICPGCDLDKALCDYGATESRCLSCSADRAKSYRKANPDIHYKGFADYRARMLDAFVESFSRLEIFERDAWVCGICHDEIDPALAHPHPLSPSVDHVVPLSRGGTHERANVQAAHLRCNLQKSNKVAYEVT